MYLKNLKQTFLSIFLLSLVISSSSFSNIDTFAASSTFTVNSTLDLADDDTSDGICETVNPGECTLRAAIEQANSNNNPSDVDVVEFNIPITDPSYRTSPRVHWEIRPSSDLPTITESVRLLANTQPGFVDEPVILINGSNISTGKGLTIQANNSEVRSFVINNLRNINNSQAVSIYLFNSNNSIVAGNYVGLGVNGTSGTGNRNGIVSLNSSNVVIGGSNLLDRNIVANNYSGIYIQSVSNLVENNYVNFNKDGSNIVNNNSTASGISGFFHNDLVVKNNLVHSRESDRIGIRLASNVEVVDNIISTNINQSASYPARSNYIADSIEVNNIDGALIQNNIIAGYKNGTANNFESFNGISLIESNNIEIYSNQIGTNQQESLDFGFEINGIAIDASTNITIGGDNNKENTIANNGENAIALNNTTSNNTINISNNSFSNNLKGISLNPSLGSNSLPNDIDDADTGANNLQNYPELNSASLNGNNLETNFKVDSSIGNSSYPLTVDFYIQDGDSRQGKTWLGEVTYTEAEAQTNVTKSIDLSAISEAVNTGDRIITTATDNDGNTSEFSESITLNSAANSGDVIFTELNWKGSSASINDEWIELYNTTNQDINLEGYLVSNLGNNSNSDLYLNSTNCSNLEIKSNSYFLISKSDPSSISSMLNFESDCVIDSIDLDDAGETLELRFGGSVVDGV
jgi:CSLREA domain-containing protein